MALFNEGFGHSSDILSAALVESELNLSEPSELQTAVLDSHENGHVGTGGTTLSLDASSMPSELLKWTNYLTNQNNQALVTNKDDIFTYFSEFGADETTATTQNMDPKSPALSQLLDEISSDLNLGDNVNANGLYSSPSTYNEPLQGKNLVTLSDLLSSNTTGNSFGGNTTTNTSNTSNSKRLNNELQTQRNKAVSRLWANEDVHIDEEDTHLAEAEDEEVDDDDLGYADTYTEYMPSKLKIGKRHPDPVVETSSLSSVAPPDIWYRTAISNDIMEKRHLSALQLEAVVYACQRHETMLGDGTRAGFLIGDGAGVGKGRTVAGIIFENHLLGRKRALWLSVSNDLKYDAIRDLRDIRCNATVIALNKFKYDFKLSSKENGNFKRGVLFATYSSLIGESQSSTSKYRSRLSQIVKWCGSNFDGVIILDECHKAKNLVPSGSSKPTKTGRTVLELQQLLPKARVVYCSATGASEPRNMAYMSRLGIWGKGTPFAEFGDFIQAIERRGVGAMELVAMDMKLRGMYMARQLSFSGVTFDIKEVPLNKKFIQVYNASAILWQQAREKFEKAVELSDNESKMKKRLWAQFWAAHQRFFKYLCIASKVGAAVAIAKDATFKDKCVVIGLQSTGEARTLEQLGETGELTEFVSTAKGVFQSLIDKHFPVPDSWKFWKSCFDEDSDNDSSKSANTAAAQKQKKRKANNFAKKGGEKKFKKEHLYGHSGLSGDEMNSDEENDGDSDVSSRGTPQRSEKESDDVDDNQDDDDDDDSDSDSDDDNWLKQIKEKPKKKAKSKSANATPMFPDETSMDALAAAGLNVKTLAWNKPAAQKITTAVVAAQNAQSSGSSTSFDSVLTKLASQPKCNGEIPPAEGLVDFIKSSSMSAQEFESLSPEEQCRVMKTELLNKLDFLGQYLPTNTLDQLMEDLGGSEYVAEMTGRKGRVVSSNGSVVYESRSQGDVSLELLNIAEKKRFMDGEKNVAIISEAASSGISLQADRRAKNQRRRVHITLELPWSADKAIQQFGRTHRSNQVSAPEYLFLISKLSGEQRFASIVAKRLESLGALTHGDRRATESRDLSKFNFDNKYGKKALEVVLKSVLGQMRSMVDPPVGYIGDFFADVRTALIGVGMIVKGDSGDIILDKDYNNISRFLNRLLGVEVDLQNALFEFFTNTLAAVVLQAKRNGRYDEGISDLGSQGEDVHRVQTVSLANGSAELHTVRVERGLSWEKAVAMLQDHELPNEGFYLSRKVGNNKHTAILVKTVMDIQNKQTYHVHRPNTGLQQKQTTIKEIERSYEKIAVWAAKATWTGQYDFSETQCGHSYWKGNCKTRLSGLTCSNGLRTLTYHILSGSVLKVWTQVEGILATQGGSNSRMRIIRAKTVDGLRIVGSSIPSNCVDALIRALSPPAPGDKTMPLEIV